MRSLAHRALPALLVGAVAPNVCFLVGRHEWGLGAGVALALGWNFCAQLLGWLASRRVSGLLCLNLASLASRGALALALGSATAFFLVPAIVTAAAGLACVASCRWRTPLIAAVARELIPPEVLDLERPELASLLARVSLLYGTEQLVAAAGSVLLLSAVSTSTYAAVHPEASAALAACVVAVFAPRLVRDLARLRAGSQVSEPRAERVTKSRPQEGSKNVAGPWTVEGSSLEPLVGEALPPGVAGA